MDIVIPATPSEVSLLAIGQGSIEIANSIKIDSPAMLEVAGEELRAVVAKKKELNDQRLSITRPIDTAKTNVMNLFKKPIEFLENAESILKRAIASYQTEQRQIAENTQRELDAAAAKEKARLAAEAKALEDEVAALEKSGGGDAEMIAEVQSKAEELRFQAATTVPAVAVQESAKVTGISSRQNWKYEITDVALIPREYLMVNESAIGQVVKAMKENTSIPGIRAYNEGSIAVRVAA